PNLGNGEDNVFENVSKETCILYVPKGTKELYAKAHGWKDFMNIVEMGGFELSVKELTMEAGSSVQTIQITTKGQWSAVCDKDWLTFSPTSGTSTQTVSLTCQKNTASEPRTATVTFFDGNGYSKALTISQKTRMNTIPVANAGIYQFVEGGTIVQLDGSGSTDADGDTLTYLWRAPDGITLSSTSDAKPTFTAPDVKTDTTYTFKLTVKDGENSVSDKVFITIIPKSVELTISADTVVFESRESSAKIMVTGNARWYAMSDHEWITVSPTEGDGQKEITLTVLANKAAAERKATITVFSPVTDSQTITVTQHGMAVGVEELANSAQLRLFPNPFTTEIAIEIINPSLKEVNVEVYSISGQKIRSLLKGQKGAKISLSWNGEDEQGKLVPEGMYLLKVNGETRKVVKR
ncbi:MAG: BACON domain-containing protein, partial [Candidatus Dadabacteria bacterium]